MHVFDEHNKYMKFGLHLILCIRHNTCLKLPTCHSRAPHIDKTLNFLFALTYTHKQVPPHAILLPVGRHFPKWGNLNDTLISIIGSFMGRWRKRVYNFCLKIKY